ncbi:hypothetical protein FQA39_LY08125 [Lamprigera yunnana]|nr:hypothetical protein FQA39_LY08125 [Lamprigera yunnana]
MLAKVWSTNLIQKEASSDYENCYLHVIRHNFKEEDTLNFVTSGNADKFLFGLLNNPYVVVNIENEVLLKLQSARNFIIFAENDLSLLNLMTRLKNSTIWDNLHSSKGKFLIITFAENLSKVFEILWQSRIIDIIVLVPSYNTGSNTLYMSDPFQDGNQCGNSSSIILNQTCTGCIIKLVEIPVKNLGKCNISFYNFYVQLPPVQHILKLILTDLALNLNGTFSPYNQARYYNHSIAICAYFNDKFYHAEKSKVVYRQNWVWITPLPVRIFPVETITALFRMEVWILTALIFVFTIITWWLALTLKISWDFSKLSLSFIDITSLTLCGTISRIPKTKILCYIFFVYSLYVLLIQTAFKTNLIYELTLPKYSGVLSNAKEIIELKFSVNIPWFYYRYISIYNGLKGSDYNKLKELAISCNNSECIDSIHRYRNRALLITEVEFSLLKQNQTQRHGLQMFIDNSVVGLFQIALLMHEESGIYGKKYANAHNTSNKIAIEDILVPLNLQHLSSVFLLLVVGLLLSFIVFLLEYLHNKYRKK